MTIQKLKQKKAAKEAEIARLEERIKLQCNQRLKLLGIVADELLNDSSYKTVFINKAYELLSYPELKKLELTDRYGNDIAECLQVKQPSGGS